jgi:hypothetical protein
MKAIVLSARSPNCRPCLRRGFLLIPLSLLLVGVALAQKAEAVNPPPDGGYPGANTAEGTQSLLNLTTGVWNTALGFQALYHDTTGNTNTATGLRALFSNTIGYQNVANGVHALYSNTTGFNNTANGTAALLSNLHGTFNTANGAQALFSNTVGARNTAVGYAALYKSTGSGNTATGWAALYNTTGSANTAIGHAALFDNTVGEHNTAIGSAALYDSTGGHNTALGSGAGISVTTASNVIAIGTNAANVSNSCFIGNIRGVTTANANVVPVLIDSAGQLGTMSSSRRFKNEIKPMDSASETLLALKPVMFHYKSDASGTPQFGLIAEEVAEVNPDLVVCDENGEVYTVRYDAVNAMLLNEFLKEHRKVEEQQATITQLKKEMETFAARLKEQDSKIQKVSAQLEVNKPSPKTVLNSR